MAIAPQIITRGYGNGTFKGTIALVVTRGYAIGEEAGNLVDNDDTPTAANLIDNADTPTGATLVDAS